MSPAKKTGSPHIKTGASPERRPGRPSIDNDELLAKALDLFLDQGFERTSIDGIAAAAGIAKRTLYLRYQDKETLFQAALQRAIKDWIVPEEQLRAVECNDLEKTLLDIGRILLKKVLAPESLRLIRLAKAESIRTPEISVYAYQLGIEQTLGYLANLLKRRILHAEIKISDWSEVAISFLYLVISGPPSMIAWGILLDDDGIERHIYHSVQMFLYGILPRNEVEQRALSAPQVTLNSIGPHTSSADNVNVSTEAKNLIELQNENRRLKKLLLASMLEVESLKEQ